MKKIFIFFLLSIVSCKEKYDYNYNLLSENPDYHKEIENPVNLKLVKELNITSPSTSPIQYFDSYIFRDSLYFGIQESNKIDVYDLTNEKFIKTIELKKYEVSKNISNVFVKNLDSIFITNFSPPAIYHINFDGQVIDKMSPGVLKLDIKNDRVPKDVINYRLPLFLSYQKPLVHKNLMFINIEPIGSSKQPGFRNTQRIGIFDMEKSRWKKSICKPEGLMALDETFFNQDLMNPFFINVKDKLYVTYPMSHYVYIYDLDGDMIEKKIVSAKNLDKIPMPLSRKELNSRQKTWNYRIQVPFYGPLFYHKDSKTFSRIFHQKQDLYKSDGILNDGAERKGYVLVFNKDLEKIGEYEFEKAKLGIGKVTPLSDGLLIGRSKFYWEKENQFIQKYIYKLENYGEKKDF